MFWMRNRVERLERIVKAIEQDRCDHDWHFGIYGNISWKECRLCDKKIHYCKLDGWMKDREEYDLDVLKKKLMCHGYKIVKIKKGESA